MNYKAPDIKIKIAQNANNKLKIKHHHDTITHCVYF
jgi:hypothetical protein